MGYFYLMANKKAIYKDKWHNKLFNDWWDKVTSRGMVFQTSDRLYVSYVLHHIKQAEYDGIVGYDDFLRLAYKNGVMKLGQNLPYGQAETWRPSDESVMRYLPSRQLDDVTSAWEINLREY